MAKKKAPAKKAHKKASEKQPDLSPFDKLLKKAIEFNPKKKK